jgi:hypothetical protein
MCAATLHDRARANLLGDEYGKFDLIEELLPASLLINARPRQIRRWIAEELQLPVEAVPYKTFSSWLGRYRARKRQLGWMPGTGTSPRDGSIDPSTHQSPQPGDWRSFVASEPRQAVNPDEPLMTFPDYASDSPNQPHT